MNGSQAAAFYDTRQSEAISLMTAYQELLAHVDASLEILGGQIKVARLELGQAYLPRLAKPELERVKSLTGFLGFERRDPIKAMAQEQIVLKQTIARIASDERYQQRETLASEHGTLQTKLFEIRENLGPWEAECQTFEAHQGFYELVQIGYDTPRFDSSWWQADYWRYWAAGDRICKALEMDDFGDDVLPKYLRAQEQRVFWLAEQAAILKQLEAVHALVHDHDQAVARIPKLESLYLAQCQSYLGEYLEQADTGLLESWLTEQGGERSILIALRTMAGIKAKQGFFSELRSQGIAKSLESLRARSAKFARKTQKYLRAKNYSRNVPDRELDHKFKNKVRKLRASQAKLRRTVDTVMAYDAYSRFSLDNDPALWWVEFTGKQPPRGLSETRKWFDRAGKDWRIEHDLDNAVNPSFTSAVAAATLSRDLDEVGYLS